VAISQAANSSCPDITLVVAVTDKSGTPVPGLDQTRFSVSENGSARVISSVTSITTPKTVSAALLMDYSGSMTPFIGDIEAATTSFVNQMSPNDQAEIIKFSGTVEVKQAFTSDKNLLNTAVASAFTATPATILYDALWRGIDDIKTQPSANVHALVVISDGVDENGAGVRNFSIHSLTQVINYANQNGVAIYTIGLGFVDAEVLTQLASSTGGQYFFAPSSAQLSQIYQAIRNIFDGQYTVEYQSGSAGSNGSPIMLGVTVVDQSGNEGVVSKQITGCP
jgi:VWFA-related protein